MAIERVGFYNTVGAVPMVEKALKRIADNLDGKKTTIAYREGKVVVFSETTPPQEVISIAMKIKNNLHDSYREDFFGFVARFEQKLPRDCRIIEEIIDL